MLCVIEKGFRRPAHVTPPLFPSLASRAEQSGRDGCPQAIPRDSTGDSARSKRGLSSQTSRLAPAIAGSRSAVGIRVQVMSFDLEEQEDEVLALQSIFSPEEFGRNESKVGGEIRVCVDVPAGFSVAAREGKGQIKRGCFLVCDE